MSHITKIDDTKFKATDVRIAYPDLSTPRAFKNDAKNTPRFACHVLLPKTDTAGYELLKTAISTLAKAELKKDRIPQADTCLRDGDESNQESYHGNWVLSLYRYPDDKKPNNNAPAVVGPRKVNDAFVRLVPGDTQFPYSGCRCNVIMDLYAAKKWGKISGGFSTVQFKADDGVIGGSGDISYLDEVDDTDGL